MTAARPSAGELRWFGLTLLAVFGVVGALLAWRLESLAAARALWLTGALLAAVYYAVRPLRVPLFRAWMAAVTPIGWAVSHALLALIYYLVLTPIGLVRRALGRDALDRRFDRSAPSYWTEHDPGGDVSRYLRQS